MVSIRTFNVLFRPIQHHKNIYLRVMSECLPSVTSVPTTPLKRSSSNVTEEVDSKQPRLETQRIKKRKYAILICYSGQGYLGLQRNKGMKTIEEDILVALLKAGVINEEAFDFPKSLDFQRAARTDKGVSAVRQVLSAKLPEDLCLSSVNTHLPDQIRMVAVKRTTKGFNCKSNCDARTYSYMMPTYALAPQSQPIDHNYRVPSSLIQRTNSVLQKFLGTHNYHNFTSRKKPLDPSAKRYIINFECSEPFVSDGMEFVILKVKGQSFMLHQIRKMVGLTVAIVREITSEETLTKAYGEQRLDLPVAPGVGLVLEEVHYDRYNLKFGNDGIHEPIEWSSVEEQLEEFKKKFILPTIIKTEKNDKSMLTWLESLPLHTFDIRQGDRNYQVKEEEEEEDGDAKESDSVNGHTENSDSLPEEGEGKTAK